MFAWYFFFLFFFRSSWMESEDFYLQPLPLFCRMMKALEIVWLFRLIFTDCRPTFSLSIVSTFLFTFLVDFNVIVRLRTNLHLYERTTCPWQIQKVLKQFSCASKVSLQKKVEWSFFANLIFLFSISGKNHFFFKREKKNLRWCVSKVRCNNVLNVTVE